MTRLHYILIICVVLTIVLFIVTKDDYDSRPIRINQTHFRQKYLNKIFTKSDLANVSIFNSNELFNYFRDNYDHCDLFHGMMHKLITTGINVVNDNSNFTLRLHAEFDSCQTIIYINDTKRNCDYKIKYGNKILMKATCNNKIYEFRDLDRLELYFAIDRFSYLLSEIYFLLNNKSKLNKTISK